MLVATKTNSNSCHFSNRSWMFREELGRSIFVGFAVMDDLKKTDAGRRMFTLRLYDKTANKLLAKIGDESQAVVVRMQELRRIYRSEIITRCTLHFTYRWWFKCTDCAGCIWDASQVVFKMHKLWGRGDGSQMHHKTWMKLRGTLSGHTW